MKMLSKAKVRSRRGQRMRTWPGSAVPSLLLFIFAFFLHSSPASQRPLELVLLAPPYL